MSRPPKYSIRRLSASLPAEQVDWLEEMAWRKHQPLSHYVRDMVGCWMNTAQTAYPSDIQSATAEFPVRAALRANGIEPQS
jgi:hypothetical protein